jgi:hypothetical protein
VALLDGGADDARDADAVAAHFHDLVLALLVEEGAFHRFGVLGAQLEDVADLDAAAQLQRALAVGRGSPSTTLRMSATWPVAAGRGRN